MSGLQVPEVPTRSARPAPSWINTPSGSQSGPLSRATSPLPLIRKYDTDGDSLSTRPPSYTQSDPVLGGVIDLLENGDSTFHLKRWKKIIHLATPILAVSTLSTYTFYFTLRVSYTLAAQRARRNNLPIPWIFIAAEIGVAIPMLMQMFWATLLWKCRSRQNLRLRGSEGVPMVDVLITCCGEDVDMILDTTRAACALEYPYDRYQVLVLDDGKSKSLEQAVGSMQQQYSHLFYASRDKVPGRPHHFKAGNLNFGLEWTQKSKGGPGEFLAALDADMIPESCWLRSALARLILDSQCGLVCPPQLFYNVPRNDPLCQTMDYFFTVSEPIKDSLGVAWCTGSGYVVRRQALDGIGSFPTGTLSEDIETSSSLLGPGWKTAYIQEPLQRGTVPDSYLGHLKQRTRWAIGTIQTSLRLRFGIYGSKSRKMTFVQRLSTFIYAWSNFLNPFIILSIFAVPIVLASGKTLVPYANIAELRWLIRVCFTAFFTNRLCEFALFIPCKYATGQRICRSQIWMAPYLALSIFRSLLLPTWLGGSAKSFTPTGSISSDLKEWDRNNRANLFRRLKVICWNYLALLHMLFIIFTLAAVVLSIVRSVRHRANETTKEILISLLTHTFWVPVPWLATVGAFITPLFYTISPPSMPDREELLSRDQGAGVAHSTEGAKRIKESCGWWLYEVEYELRSVYIALVLGATFWWI